MEFHRVFGRELGGREDAQGFEEDDYTGAVVIGARAAGGGGSAGGVEMRSYDDEAGGGTGDADYNAGLVVGVGELREGDGGVGGRDGFNLIEEPSAGLSAV